MQRFKTLSSDQLRALHADPLGEFYDLYPDYPIQGLTRKEQAKIVRASLRREIYRIWSDWDHHNKSRVDIDAREQTVGMCQRINRMHRPEGFIDAFLNGLNPDSDLGRGAQAAEAYAMQLAASWVEFLYRAHGKNPPTDVFEDEGRLIGIGPASTPANLSDYEAWVLRYVRRWLKFDPKADDAVFNTKGVYNSMEGILSGISISTAIIAQLILAHEKKSNGQITAQNMDAIGHDASVLLIRMAGNEQKTTLGLAADMLADTEEFERLSANLLSLRAVYRSAETGSHDENDRVLFGGCPVLSVRDPNGPMLFLQKHILAIADIFSDRMGVTATPIVESERRCPFLASQRTGITGAALDMNMGS